jgi:hypothetical protein
MKIIGHRGFWSTPQEQNSLSALLACQGYGFAIETDIRTFKGRIYLSHDPILDSHSLISLEELLSNWVETPNLPLFLNVKEDGLIPYLKPLEPLLSQLKPVFFDMSLPELLKFSKSLPSEMLATRFSEFEKEPLAIELCSWLWVDSFQSDPEPEQVRRFVEEKQMSVAIVSPEIHHRNPDNVWNNFRQASYLPTDSVYFCTDYPKKLSGEIL